LFNGYNKLHRENVIRVEAGAVVRVNPIEADPFQEKRAEFSFTVSSKSNKYFCEEYGNRMRGKI